MKKLNFLMRAALPLFLPSLAWASQVEVYGVIDTGIAVARVNGETRVYEETGFMRPSRFGFKGKEDLGNGRAVSSSWNKVLTQTTELRAKVQTMPSDEKRT